MSETKMEKKITSDGKSEKKNKKRESDERRAKQKEADEKDLNWGSTVKVISQLPGDGERKAGDSSVVSKKKKAAAPSLSINPGNEAYSLLVKNRKEKTEFKYLQEFWHKITNVETNLTGKVNLNSDSANFFWYILWLLDFDAGKLVEKYDSVLAFTLECPDYYSMLSIEHEFMSRFFGIVWDSTGVGLLCWEDFLFGWTMLMCGNVSLSQQFLFQAMDKNKDGFIIASDVIQFCLLVFAREKRRDDSTTSSQSEGLAGKKKAGKQAQHVSSSAIESLVTDIFSHYGNGPFDPIDFYV